MATAQNCSCEVQPCQSPPARNDTQAVILPAFANDHLTATRIHDLTTLLQRLEQMQGAVSALQKQLAGEVQSLRALLARE